MPSYFTVNTALTHTWKNTPVGKVEGRLALINLFDKSYISTVGTNGFGNVGDNQTLLNGAPRQIFATLKVGM